MRLHSGRPLASNAANNSGRNRGPIPEITGIPMVSLTPSPLWCEFYRELAADVHVYLYRGRDGIKCGKVNNASGWRARSARLFALAGTPRGQTG